MEEMDFTYLMRNAKIEDKSLMLLLNHYSPLLKKYSTINGFFYEDLYGNWVEIAIKIIKNSNY